MRAGFIFPLGDLSPHIRGLNPSITLADPSVNICVNYRVITIIYINNTGLL